MAPHVYITMVLLAGVVALTLISSIGLWAMNDPYQRLQFNAPVVTLGAALLVIAVWLDDPVWQARIKIILIALVMALTNSVLAQATARAVRIRDKNGLQPVGAPPGPAGGEKRR